MPRSRLQPSLETLHYTELPHVMRVFSFHVAQRFQDKPSGEQGRRAVGGRTNTHGITFPLT
jgi:hypothetical protein